MKVLKLVKGIQGATEFARLGNWDSLQDLKDETQIGDDIIQNSYWLNEPEGGFEEEMPFDEDTFIDQVTTVSVIRSRTYLMKVSAVVVGSVAWMRESDYENTFC